MKAFASKLCLTLILFVLAGCGPGLCVDRESCALGALLTSESGANFGVRGFYATPSISVSLRNAGQTAATEISAGSVTAPFDFLGGSYPGAGGTCGSTLDPAAVCTLIFSFSVPPPPAATYSGSVTLNYYDGSAFTSTALDILGNADNGMLATIRGFGGWVTSLVVSPHGIYASGLFYSYGSTQLNRIARLGLDFSVDSTFVTGNGFTGFNDLGASAILPLADGDILLAGQLSDYNGTLVQQIARLNSDGTLDPGFVTGSGFSGGYPRTAVLARDSSGDIYVGGSADQYNGATINYIVRLNSDGSRDAGFNTGTGFNLVVGDPVQSIAVSLDTAGAAVDDLYVGGKYTSFNGTAGLGGLVRLNSDGSLDTAFATGTGATGGSANVSTVAPALDGSGDVYVGGDFTTFNGVAGLGSIVRLNANGSRDAGFATGTGFNNSVYRVFPALDSSGDVYVLGSFTSLNGTPVKNIIRLNANGTIDSGFAGFNLSMSSAIALVDDGTYDLIAAGGWSDGTSFLQGPVRIGSDGVVKASVGGLSDTGGIRFNFGVSATAPLADGKFYLGGSMTTYGTSTLGRIVRMLPEGTVDSSFVVGTGFNSHVNRVVPAIDSSGDIYVSGSFSSYQGTTGLGGIIRLNSDGSRDTAFATGTGGDSDSLPILPANDGSGDVYLGGYFTNFNGTVGVNRIIRLNSDGSRDTTFATGTGFTGGVGTVYALALAIDGDVYAGGMFTTFNGTGGLGGIVRLNPDGSRDAAFATGTGFNSADVRAIVPATDGSGDVYIGGQFTTFNGSAVGSVVRLNSDGSRDTAFTFQSTTLTLGVIAAPDTTGDLYAIGCYDTYGGETVKRLVRINPDGTKDPAFVSEGFDEWSGTSCPQDIAPARDGTADVYVVHPHYSYNGTATGFVTRIAPDGTME